MGSEPTGVEYAGMKTPPRLCYHALPSSQRAEPLGMATPPLQAPGSVPFQWEVVPGKPRGADDEPHNRHKPASGRRLELPARMALLSSSSTTWQVAKVADAHIPSKTVLGGPYYVLLRPSPSLFDGPSVMVRSTSLSCASFGRYTVGEEGRRKERPAAWFWKRAAGKRDGGSSVRKKGDAVAVSRDGEAILTVEGRGGGACGHDEAAAAANVKITRFRKNGSLPNLSAAGTRIWVSIYGGLRLVVTPPWKTRKPASGGDDLAVQPIESLPDLPRLLHGWVGRPAAPARRRGVGELMWTSK